MLRYLEERFAGQRAKIRVVSEFLRLGIRVGAKGAVFCGPIELAPAKVGRALSVDRRVVIETAKEIASDPRLMAIFSELYPVANVSMAARALGHDVLEIDADPNSIGLVSEVSGILARHKVKIRQIIADDPELYPEPKMRVVAEGRIPPQALAKLRKLSLQSISIR